MRVGIITFHFPLNYGAVLQAYALSECIKSLGHDAFLIDYKPDYHIKRYLWNWAYCGLNFTNLIYPLLHKSFGEFSSKHLRLSSRSYKTLEELTASPPEADAYICGSDQIWNSRITNLDPAYFLTFAPQGTRRIAYAGSFGISEIDKAVQLLYTRWLKDITHLSAREKQGAEIIRQLTGRNAPVVLDPTLLLTKNEWEALSQEPSTKDPYIFCYSLNDVPGLMELCYYAQKLTGYPIYKIGGIKDVWNRRVKAVVGAGPQEFLGYINYAAIVITNSFHGTVLSMNMQRPFFTIPSPVTGTYSRNSRLFSILQILSATDRLYRPGQEFPSIADFEIAYDMIAERLVAEREKSLSYLKHAIYNGKAECASRKGFSTS